MFKYSIVTLILFSWCIITTAQTGVAISDSDTTAHPSAILDITSVEQGVLIPRMTSTQRDNIASPETGLLIFNSTNNGFYYYTGSEWEQIGIGNSSAQAQLELNSTSKGFLPPRLNESQIAAISSPSNGLIVYNTTLDKLQCFDGTDWRSLH